MVAVCVKFSHGRLFWADEEYSLQILRDPSFLHMFVGWREGVDGGGIFYYIFGRLWINLFGISELRLRLFSAACVIVSFIITWSSARRYFTIAPVAISLSLLYLTSPCILWQDVNGRFYGLLLAAAALACAAFLHTARTDTLRARDLAFVFLAHLLLVGSHILGIVYSASLLVAMLAFDTCMGRRRPTLYAAASASWFLLVFSYRAIINSTSIAKGKFWALKPTFMNLISAELAFDPVIKIVTGLLIVGLIGMALRNRRQSAAIKSFKQIPAAPWAWLIGALALAELALFVKSRIGLSLWSDRYLLPVQIGTAFLLAALVSRLLNTLRPESKRRFAMPLSVSVLLLCFGWALKKPAYADVYPTAGTPEQLEALLPSNHIVLSASYPLFLLMRHYDPTHQYEYPMDWIYDSKPSRASQDYSAERFMGNWQRAGYMNGQLPDCAAIYSGPTSFTVILDQKHQQWMLDRIVKNPAFHVQQSGSFNKNDAVTLWDVHRLAPGGDCR